MNRSTDAHLDRIAAVESAASSSVPGPVPRSRMRAAGTKFVIEPYVRFKGQVGEQATFFLYDPSGNALEFKAFADPERLFAK